MTLSDVHLLYTVTTFTHTQEHTQTHTHIVGRVCLWCQWWLAAGTSVMLLSGYSITENQRAGVRGHCGRQGQSPGQRPHTHIYTSEHIHSDIHTQMCVCVCVPDVVLTSPAAEHFLPRRTTMLELNNLLSVFSYTFVLFSPFLLPYLTSISSPLFCFLPPFCLYLITPRTILLFGHLRWNLLAGHSCSNMCGLHFFLSPFSLRNWDWKLSVVSYMHVLEKKCGIVANNIELVT